MMQGPPPNMPPFGGATQFGMPPPGWMPPWGMPGLLPPQQTIPPLVGATPGGVGGSMMFDDGMLMAHIDPEVLARAGEWSEHRAPDGRSYYYNAKKGESVWERPQPLKDLDGKFIYNKLSVHK